MQIKLAGWIALAFLGAIIVGILWYLLFAPLGAPPASRPSSTVTLPSSGAVTVPPSTTDQSGSRIPIPIQNGTVITTKDFIHTGTTIEDPANAGNYYLTGSSTQGFAIGYRTPAQFFTIALEQEPLGATRLAAEHFLMTKLGISESQMCALPYYLGTDVHTNSLYAGRNLGFSFCPGAVALPQ